MNFKCFKVRNISYSLNFTLGRNLAVVKKGGTGDFSFSLPGGVPVDVSLQSVTATVTTTFISPNGTVLQTGPGVDIHSGTGFFGPETVLSLDAAHAQAGTWKVKYSVTSITPTATKSILELTVLDSNHTLTGTFTQLPISLKATQSGDAIVSLLNGSTPLHGAGVKLTLASGDVTLIESLTEPGTYTTPITFAAAGAYTGQVQVTSNGKTSYAGVVFNVLPASTALGTALTDAGVSNSPNGLYDILKVTVPVTVDTAQHYRLTGTLRTTSGKIITAQTEVDLNAGTSSIDLKFDGNTIYQTGDSGPYTIENLILHAYPNGLSAKLIDTSTLNYRTAAYQIGSFQHKAVHIDATQAVTSIASDTDSDDKLDHIEVTIPILSEEAAASLYNWSASLYDVNGTQLSQASNSGTIVPGPSTITLDFNAATIGPNAIDGPFLLGSFLLYGQSPVSQNAVAQITTPPINQFVGFIPCALTASDVQFPETQLPAIPAAKTSIVTNTGTARCVLVGVDVSPGDFTATPASSFPLIMKAGAKTSLSVALVNTTAGKHSATIRHVAL